MPVDESKIDFPIHYGRSLGIEDKYVMFQRGRTFRARDDINVLFDGFSNIGIGRTFNVNLSILKKCIKEKSNIPYWKQENKYQVQVDLRNPKYKEELKQICKQFDLN